MTQKSNFYMMVGLPCSGKTTWIEENLQDAIDNGEMLYLSSDKVITDYADWVGKTYSEAFPHLINPAAKLVKSEIQLSSYAELNMVLDQTNVTKSSRASKLRLIKDRDKYNLIAVYLDTPYGIVMDRLSKRNADTGKVIPVGVVEDMYTCLQPPSEVEGFNEIIRIETKVN